jgi:hypothetical protein
MPCLKCLQKPGYHSFVKFASIGSASLFYTSPAKTADFNEDGTKLASIKLHISEECAEPWIWVVDCGDMGLAHYTDFSFNWGLLGLLAADLTLQEIWIVRPNLWIRGVIAVLQTFSSAPILGRIKYFDGSDLELEGLLCAEGLPALMRHWLISTQAHS